MIARQTYILNFWSDVYDEFSLSMIALTAYSPLRPIIFGHQFQFSDLIAVNFKS